MSENNTTHTNNNNTNEQEQCVANGFNWFEVSLDEVVAVPYPVCERTGFSRVNQLGNSHDPVVDFVPEIKLTAGEQALNVEPHLLNANRFRPCHFVDFLSLSLFFSLSLFVSLFFCLVSSLSLSPLP